MEFVCDPTQHKVLRDSQGLNFTFPLPRHMWPTLTTTTTSRHARIAGSTEALLLRRSPLLSIPVSDTLIAHTSYSSIPSRTHSATMCTQVTHEYTVCKHKVVERIPCAASRRGPCGVSTPRTVVHHSKCYKCGGGGWSVRLGLIIEAHITSPCWPCVEWWRSEFRAVGLQHSALSMSEMGAWRRVGRARIESDYGLGWEDNGVSRPGVGACDVVWT